MKDLHEGAEAQRTFRPPARWQRMVALAPLFLFQLATWIVPPPRGLTQSRWVHRIAVIVWANAYWWEERSMGRV